MSTEPRVMRLGPSGNGRKIALVHKLRQGESPIVADGGIFRPAVKEQGRKMRGKVVATPPAELLQQIIGPVRAENFQTVAEHRIG